VVLWTYYRDNLYIMTIIEQVKSDMKDAMRAKDSVALTTIRGLISACTNELVATGKTPQDEVTDDIALTVIKRASKQRKDAIEQYIQGGRTDLVENEQAELAVIEKYLPQTMSKDQIKTIAEAKIAEFGGDKSKIGQIIGAVIKETAGQADGGDVKSVVMELLG
jgi:uncharacterized protein YqeY